MDDTMLDGNATAGMLQQVFAAEVTTARATCRTCGAASMLGEARVFRGAGFVLRCPRCDNPLVTIVDGDTRMWLGFPGIRSLEMSP
jgi:Zn finger protein HypA/HybF involved in hydrogenase expression